MSRIIIDWIWRFLGCYAGVVALRKYRKWSEQKEAARISEIDEERERQKENYDIYGQDETCH